MQALKAIQDNRLVVVLKSRQVGLTWLCLSYILHQMLFNPVVTALVFSRREDEAIYLVNDRLKGMYKRLPEWMRARKVITDSEHVFELSTGSIVYGFPTTAGDSYTASIALVDEADLIPDLNQLMNSVKPTIDAGGKMILLSRSNKDSPDSPFKQIYKRAVQGTNGWYPVFLPWNCRPDRTEQWYEDQKREIAERTGSLDDLYAQYPATDMESLAPRVVGRRFPARVVDVCFERIEPQDGHGPIIPDLRIYKMPIDGAKYVIGVDPSEGDLHSDPSPILVLDKHTGEEVAFVDAKAEPAVLGSYIVTLAAFYNDAAVMPERNNHGHALILWLRDNSEVTIMAGEDGDDGWHTNSRSKALMCSTLAEDLADRSVLIHTETVAFQLTSIESATLRAPKRLHDDAATALMLANLARRNGTDVSVSYQYAAAQMGGSYVRSK